ncbi:MAG: hypothetical protein LBQ54_09200 [Planctomycetaceae bacterium]|jgi:hypothetical protein|nr:hypothetical protein [Planctomycetaceae bacterium]
MIDKIIRLLGIGTLYFAASLFFASIILAVYFWYSWGMDHGRLYKALAVAQGFDIYGTEEKITDSLLQKANEIHYQTVLDERTMKTLNISMANMAANESLEQIQAERQALVSNKGEMQELQDRFQKQLKDLEEESKSKGISDLTGILESLEAENAKKYLLDMIEKGEYYRVIFLLRGMDLKKRSKILNEFQEDDEIPKLADILRRIGNGEPEAELVEAMRQEMERVKNKKENNS